MHNLDLVPSKLQPPNCAAEALLTRALLALSRGFTQLEAFRVPVLAGLDAGLPTLELRYRTFVDSVLKDLQIPRGAPEEIDAAFSGLFTPVKREAALQAIDASSLVFAHALFEATIHSLLEVACIVRQRALLKRLRGRSLPVAAYLDGTLDVVAAALVTRYVSELKRLSLPQKLEALLALFRCRSAFHGPPVPIELQRLAAIDRKRQALLHGDLFGEPLRGVAEDIDYLYAAGNFFIAVVATSAALEASLLEALTGLFQPKGAA